MIKLRVKQLPEGLKEKRILRALRKALKAGAETYTKEIHETIDSGKAFTPRTGNLQNSIGWRAESDTKAVVFAEAEYVPFVEFGTKPHVIRPKDRKALFFVKNGKKIFAKKVNHPGSKPYPFFYVDLEKRAEKVKEAFLEKFLEELQNG